jgi:hypothetical protein
VPACALKLDDPCLVMIRRYQEFHLRSDMDKSSIVVRDGALDHSAALYSKHPVLIFNQHRKGLYRITHAGAKVRLCSLFFKHLSLNYVNACEATARIGAPIRIEKMQRMTAKSFQSRTLRKVILICFFLPGLNRRRIQM